MFKACDIIIKQIQTKILYLLINSFTFFQYFRLRLIRPPRRPLSPSRLCHRSQSLAQQVNANSNLSMNTSNFLFLQKLGKLFVVVVAVVFLKTHKKQKRSSLKHDPPFQDDSLFFVFLLLSYSYFSCCCCRFYIIAGVVRSFNAAPKPFTLTR